MRAGAAEAGVSSAILMMLAAYLLFALADSTTKWLVLTLPALQIAFLRYAVHFLICSTEVAVRGIEPREVTENFGWLMLRGFLLASATVGNFYALKYLPLSMYSAIMFSAPIFVSLLAWPLLGERVGPWRWWAIVFGFIGVLIIVKPFDVAFHWSSLFSLYAAIALAFYSIVTRKLSHRVRPHIQQFFTGAFGTVMLMPFAISLWVPIDWQIVLFVTWVGSASWAGHELLTRAHKLAEASVLMPYSYSFIVYMTLTGYLFYAEVPDLFTVVGAAVIVCSGLVIWYREQVHKRRDIKQVSPSSNP